MPAHSTQQLRTALNFDLRKSSPAGLEDVVNDEVRRIFTARIAGAVLEFAHKQGDLEYWSGVKYYGSGSQNRIRVRRSPVAVEAVVASAPRKRKTTRVAK